MKRKVSVIIPVYNCKNYLKRAIESVINQKDFEENEIILIDDGSTDGSSDICDEYASRYSNICAIHQSNAGVSVARNNGISKAQGEWVFFLDSDDYVSDNIFDIMLNQGDADIICAKHESNNSDLPDFEKSIQPGIYNTEEIMPEFISILTGLNHFFYPCWSKLFRLSVIKEKNIQFPAGRKYAEDMVFVYSYLLHCKTISLVKDRVYFYYVNSENATSVVQRSFDTALFIFNWQSDYFKNFGYNYDQAYKFVESAFLYRVFLSIKTAAVYIKGKKSVEYISEILNNDTFYSHYTGSDEYHVFKTKTDALLDKFIRKKRPFMIYLIFKLNQLKSKILG